MATLEKDGVKIELNEIISYYCVEDDIKDSNDIGTYEAFALKVHVNGAEILTHIFGQSVNDTSTSFELCAGNILSLMQMIEEGLETGVYQEIEFLEPNFSFELTRKPVEPKKEPTYLFHVWINDGNWEGVYGTTDMGFRFILKEWQLKNFLQALKQEWDNRKKEKY